MNRRKQRGSHFRFSDGGRCAVADRGKRFLAWHGLSILGWMAIVTGTLLGTTRADDYDQQFLEGLRSRRLFELATSHCRRELAGDDLTAASRAEWNIELVRTLAEQAIHTPRSQRGEVWQELERVVEEVRLGGEDVARRPQVLFQYAVAQLAKGDLLRRESEVVNEVTESQLRTEALDAIRAATRELESLADDLRQRIPLARDIRPGNDEGRLTAGELRTLQNHVQLQLGRAFRLRGEAYPAKSDDRIAALTAALEQFKELLSRLPADDSLMWELRQNQAICYRLLESYQQAQRTLVALQDPAAPSKAQLEGRAERIRLQLAAGRAEGALPLLKAGREIHGAVSPELDLAWLETFVALWETAERQQDQETAKQWRDQALAMSQSIEAVHGAYWGRRADRLLVSHAGANPDSHDLELLRRQADATYLKGDLDEAVDAYDAAFALARSAMQFPEAFELGYKAALVRQKQGRLEDYATRLRQLALQLAPYPQASSAHLQAIRLAIEDASSDPSRIGYYRELLEEHLETFPSAETANRVRLWLARVFESQGNWEDAVETLREVDPASSEFSQAIEAIGRVYLLWITALNREGEAERSAADETLKQAAGFFREVVGEGANGAAPDEETRREAALAAARLAVTEIGLENAQLLGEVERYLAGALELPREPAGARGPTGDSWRSEASGLLVVVLAAQPGRQQDALVTLRKAMEQPGQTVEGRYQVLAGIARVARQSSGERSRGLAEIQLAATGELWANRRALPADRQRLLAEVRSQALAATGQTTQAIEILDAMVEQFPRDGSVHESLATLLVDSGETANVQKGLGHWRLIARRSRPGTERWYRAKYHVALAMSRLGQHKEANQLIRYVEATAGLEKSQFADQFRTLLKATAASPVP